MRPLFLSMLTIVAATVIVACDGYPRDPNNSLTTAKAEGLRVGASEDPPWVVFKGDAVKGIEAELISGFAQSIDAQVQWTQGNQAALMRLLSEGELHLVIGGITRNNPWTQRVGTTNVFVEEQSYVCSTSPALPIPANLEGQVVAVRSASVLIAELRKHKAVAMPLADLDDHQGLIAVSERELSRYPCDQRRLPLAKQQHVLAVQKGENGLLMALEEYLNVAGY